MYLKQEYICNNSIVGADSLDLQLLFVGDKYDILTQTQAKELKDKKVKIYGEGALVEPMRTYFNDEELFYMNRVAFYLYRYKGDNLTFELFKQRLFILQNGQQFSKQVNFWLSLMDENDEDMLCREQFERFVRISFVQDVNFKSSPDAILYKIFPEDKSEKVNVGKILRVIETNEEVKELMKCILQTS
mmetsp:Transcript_30563/g.30005  ORF Transcript_30563/g.30005 Transcript_30563/m.30005 type:complete len:188 (-) Transcript_30563:38-601(-)